MRATKAPCGFASATEKCEGRIVAELLSNSAQGRQTQQGAGPSTATSDAASATARVGIFVSKATFRAAECPAVCSANTSRPLRARGLLPH